MPGAPDDSVSLLVHAIQLAIAPVFLLTGLGALLSVMTTRLARVIDRARVLEDRWPSLDAGARVAANMELEVLARRARLAGWAINLCTTAALMVCTVIGAIFIDVFTSADLKWLVGALFVIAMLAVIGGLISFLREVYLATHTLRIGPPL